MGDVLQFGQQIAQTGLLGRKAQMGAAAMHVANTDTSSKSGGLLGTAAASGLMGHKGRMAAHAMGKMERLEGSDDTELEGWAERRVTVESRPVMSSAVASWGTRESWRELPWISSKERDEAAVSAVCGLQYSPVVIIKLTCITSHICVI